MCLKRHHLSRDCRSLNRCARCNGRHYTSICKGHANAQASNNSGARNQEPPPMQNQEATRPQNQAPQNSQNHTSTTQLYCVNTAAPVLLQTAQAYIYKPNNPSCGMTIRLLLDGGSQLSYITQRVKTALGLEPHHVEEVQIKTFGSDSATLQTVELTSAAISLKTGNSICVLFLTVPSICVPVSCQPIAYTREKYRHLADLDLADFSRVGDELQIDGLIGSDHYWQVVTGKVIQAEGGPTAIHTHLGWVLSGPVCGTTDQTGVVRSPTDHTMLISSMQLHDTQPDLNKTLQAFWE